MDNRMVKAAAAAALGIVLLLPTFNALNNSYVQNVPPPPWIPTPSTIPDVTPPSDFKPPPDMKPPPDFDASKYKGKIPPGGCPPPIVTVIQDASFNDTLDASQPSGILQIGASPIYQRSVTFSPPNGTYAIVGLVNITSWEGRNFTATVRVPGGPTWNGYANDTFDPTPRQQDQALTFNSYEFLGHKAAPRGSYTLELQAQPPYLKAGISTTFYSIIPCGGLMS